MVVVPDQLVLQFLVVLNDTVVNTHNLMIHRDVRVCIVLRGLSVGSPSGVTDADGTLQR